MPTCVGSDALSGLADLDVTRQLPASRPVDGDIRVSVGSVSLRATRDDDGPGRTYTLVATATDKAGNVTTRQATCVVPHDLGPGGNVRTGP